MSQSIGNEIKSNWMIILFIGGLIVTWTTFNARLTQAENEIDQLSQVVSDISQINLNLADIKKDNEYLKKGMDELKDKLDKHIEQ
jgi:hypothetical protein